METTIFSWQLAYYVVFAVSLGMSLSYTTVKSWQMTVFRLLAVISGLCIILKPMVFSESLIINFMASLGLVIVVNSLISLLLALLSLIFSLDVEENILDKFAGKKN